MKWLAVVLGVLAVIVGAIAAVYYTVPAHSLPSWLGTVQHAKHNVYRVRRGEAAAIAAGGVLVLGVIVGVAAWRAPNRVNASWRRLLGR